MSQRMIGIEAGVDEKIDTQQAARDTEGPAENFFPDQQDDKHQVGGGSQYFDHQGRG